MSQEMGIVFGNHFFNPKRRSDHLLFKDIETDPQHRDWTGEIDKEVYEPLGANGVLRNLSYDLSPLLLKSLRQSGSKSVEHFIDGQDQRVIGTAYIHALLPDLPHDDKEILIQAGIKHHKETYGITPRIFFPPETAMDTDTAEVLISNGYKAFICAKNQIQLNDGTSPENVPTRVVLGSGRSIVALPTDFGLSEALAFKPKNNADEFTDTHIARALDKAKNRGRRTIFTWVDGETFGHHDKGGGEFLKYLIEHALPNRGIKSVLINEVDLSQTTDGILFDRSSWSCHCGNLARWNWGCGCSPSWNNWKQPFYQTLKELNYSVTEIIRDQLGNDYQQKVIQLFDQGVTNMGVPYTNPEASLVAAKEEALQTMGSCGTFFDSPNTSGRINILHGLVATQHIREAGLVHQAQEIENQFISSLALISCPEDDNKKISSLYEDMFGSSESFCQLFSQAALAL